MDATQAKMFAERMDKDVSEVKALLDDETFYTTDAAITAGLGRRDCIA